MKSEMHPEMNFFEVQHPQECICQVWSYSVSHSRLLLRIYRGKFDEGVLYLGFEMVQYFEGPLSWKGANFYIGNTDECIKLLQHKEFEGLPEEYLLEQFHLYIVDLAYSRFVKILAA